MEVNKQQNRTQTQNKIKNQNRLRQRIPEIDFARGIAVILMVFAHIGIFSNITARNLLIINKNSINKNLINKRLLAFLLNNTLSKLTNILSVMSHSLFIILVGVNMVTNYQNSINKSISENTAKSNSNYIQKNIKRALFISMLGVFMSIFTRYIFGEWYIIFGIFQFIAVSILLAIPIQLYYNEYMVTTMILFILLIGKIISIPQQNKINIWAIIGGNVVNTYKFLDFFPLIPYFAMILIGLVIGNNLYKINYPKFNREQKKNRLIKSISEKGKWSIQIYFVHLIIIFLVMRQVISCKKIKL